MRNLVQLVFGTAVLFISLQASSQHITKPKYEVGFRLSSLIYQGDLAPSAVGSYKSLDFGAGFTGTRLIDWNWAVRVSADYGKMQGADSLYEESWRKQRNFSFKTSFLELSAQMMYTIGDNYQADRLQFYVFAGAGISFLNIKRDFSKSDPEYFAYHDFAARGIGLDSNVTVPKHCLVFPVGAGFRFGIGDYMSLFGEGTYRLMSTDYLDGFSKSANPSLLDHYTNMSVGIIYRFGDNFINCPRF